MLPHQHQRCWGMCSGTQGCLRPIYQGQLHWPTAKHSCSTLPSQQEPQLPPACKNYTQTRMAWMDSQKLALKPYGSDMAIAKSSEATAPVLEINTAVLFWGSDFSLGNSVLHLRKVQCLGAFCKPSTCTSAAPQEAPVTESTVLHSCR